MCASVSDEVTAVTDDATKVKPINGEPPGTIVQTNLAGRGVIRTKPVRIKPLTPVPTAVVKSANMGNQQGSENGKSSKKKDKKDTSQAVKSNSPNAEGGSRKGKSPSVKSKSSPASPSKKIFRRKQQPSGKDDKVKGEDSVGQGAAVSDQLSPQDVFTDATEAVERTGPSSQSDKMVCDSSSDNISFESVSCATPSQVATPSVQRAMLPATATQAPATLSPSPVHRVDELGKSIERAIMERFSDNPSVSLEVGSQLRDPKSHKVTGSQGQSTGMPEEQRICINPPKNKDSTEPSVAVIASQTMLKSEELLDSQPKVKPVRKIRIEPISADKIREEESKMGKENSAVAAEKTKQNDLSSDEIVAAELQETTTLPSDAGESQQLSKPQPKVISTDTDSNLATSISSQAGVPQQLSKSERKDTCEDTDSSLSNTAPPCAGESEQISKSQSKDPSTGTDSSLSTTIPSQAAESQQLIKAQSKDTSTDIHSSLSTTNPPHAAESQQLNKAQSKDTSTDIHSSLSSTNPPHAAETQQLNKPQSKNTSRDTDSSLSTTIPSQAAETQQINKSQSKDTSVDTDSSLSSTSPSQTGESQQMSTRQSSSMDTDSNLTTSIPSQTDESQLIQSGTLANLADDQKIPAIPSQSTRHAQVKVCDPIQKTEDKQQDALISTGDLTNRQETTMEPLTTDAKQEVEFSLLTKDTCAMTISQQAGSQAHQTKESQLSETVQSSPKDTFSVTDEQKATTSLSQSTHDDQLKVSDLTVTLVDSGKGKDRVTAVQSEKSLIEEKTKPVETSTRGNKTSHVTASGSVNLDNSQGMKIADSTCAKDKDSAETDGAISETKTSDDADSKSVASEPSENVSPQTTPFVETPTEIQPPLTSLFISEPDIIKPSEARTDKKVTSGTGPIAEPEMKTSFHEITFDKTRDVPSKQMSALDIAAALQPASRTLTLAEKRQHRLTDPLVDTLLLLIKQTMESDDVDQGEITPTPKRVSVSTKPSTELPQHSDGKERTETDQKVAEKNYEDQLTNVAMATESVGEEDLDRTLTSDDMVEFQRLKNALPSEESRDVGEDGDDDTLTQEDLAEFDRLKKEMTMSAANTHMQAEHEAEFPLHVEDRFELSSGETTEDSVIERPVKKIPVLAATQEEEANGSNIEALKEQNLESSNTSDLQHTGAASSKESQLVHKSEPPTTKKRSLTEEEIRREIRKFMIPEMQESLPNGASMKQMLNDLHDITPTSEFYPGLDEDRESTTSPEHENRSGVRSRTSITSSELDISEQRDDMSTGTDGMYADDEDDSSSEVLFCKTYTEPVRGTEVLVSCTVVNSALKEGNSSSDEFWAENSAAEDAYQQVEVAAAAVNRHFSHARSQMQDIQHHLQALKYQMQDMEKQVVKTNLPSTDEFDFDEPERRAITD